MTLEGGIENLNLNVNVTVFAPDDRNSKDMSSKIFRGQIFSKKSDQSVVIQLKAEDGYDFLNIGKPIFIFLAHDLGLYIFSAVVTRKAVEESMVVLHCTNSQQVKSFQRRKSVRVNVNIPIGFSAEFNRSRVWDGTIRNISAGGLQLEAPFLPTSSILELVFELQDVGPLFIDGRVVRASERDGRFFHGIELVNADQYTVDGIAKFVLAEQFRQKRLGLQFFRALIFNATIEIQAPTVFSVIQYKDLDISALQGKKCNGTITEIGIYGLSVECPLKLPVGSVLEFSVELPKLGYSIVQAKVKELQLHNGKSLIHADFCSEYDKIRDHILQELADDYNTAGDEE